MQGFPHCTYNLIPHSNLVPKVSELNLNHETSL